MRPEDMHPLIDVAAPAVVTLGFFIMFLRAFTEALPFSLPFKFITWGTGTIVVAGVLVALVGASPGGFVCVLVGVGLVVHLVRARMASAKSRELRAERLRQARGRERRRAQPPLPPGGPGRAP